MPYCEIMSSVNLSAAQARQMLREVKQLAAKVLGKPLSYVMANFIFSEHLTFGESDEPCCFVKVVSIGGINRANNNALAEGATKLVEKYLNIGGDRVFVKLANSSASDFAHCGRTFG